MKNSPSFLNKLSKRLLVFALPMVLFIPFVLPNAALADELTSIDDANVAGIATKSYTGKALTQTVTVSVQQTRLVKDTDYTVSYADNTYPGTATVTVTGIGDYDGSVTKTFDITRKDGTTACVNAIVKAVKEHKTTVTFPEGLVSQAEYGKAWDKIIGGSYAAFRDEYGMKSSMSATGRWSSRFQISYVSTVKLNYFLTKSQVAANVKKVNAIAAKAKKAGKTDAARIRYIHDYLVRYTAYATAYSSKWSAISSDKAHTAYGALVKHRAYCDGYSLAFMEVAKAAGVKNVSMVACLSPNGGAHAISKVGSYYYDVTWDDSTLNGRDRGTKAKVSHTYYKRTKTWMKNKGFRFYK